MEKRMNNYHTHTTRCRHAKGEDREYVENAIQSGFTQLGFSDHAPMLFPNEKYYSNFRMYPKDINDYASSISKLKEEYKDKIKIYLGYEMEYYPELFEKNYEFLKSHGLDYLVLGQHFTYNEYEKSALYCGTPTLSTKQFDKYIEQALAGLATGKFIYLAHPDLFHFIGSSKTYIEKMTYFCQEIKKLGYPIEFNLLGFADKRHYPDKRFWEIAAKVGNKVIIGFDAHTPASLSDSKTYNNAKEYLNKLGITPIKEIDINA
jgi:histidinol-phosphatase (PHP family)